MSRVGMLKRAWCVALFARDEPHGSRASRRAHAIMQPHILSACGVVVDEPRCHHAGPLLRQSLYHTIQQMVASHPLPFAIQQRDLLHRV